MVWLVTLPDDAKNRGASRLRLMVSSCFAPACSTSVLQSYCTVPNGGRRAIGSRARDLTLNYNDSPISIEPYKFGNNDGDDSQIKSGAYRRNPRCGRKLPRIELSGDS